MLGYGGDDMDALLQWLLRRQRLDRKLPTLRADAALENPLATRLLLSAARCLLPCYPATLLPCSRIRSPPVSSSLPPGETAATRLRVTMTSDTACDRHGTAAKRRSLHVTTPPCKAAAHDHTP